jgi:hypothetical protein
MTQKKSDEASSPANLSITDQLAIAFQNLPFYHFTGKAVKS